MSEDTGPLLPEERRGARLRRYVAHAGRMAVSPSVVIVGMLSAGGVCAVTGVSALAGNAWALITAAAILFALAGLMLRGAANG